MGQFKFAEAVGTLSRLSRTAAVDDEVRVDLAIALLNRRKESDLEQAASLLEGVLESEPNNARARYCRGLLWFHEGKTDQALQAFQDVADWDPSDAYAAYYVGQCRLAKKEYQLALDWFRKASEIDPYLRSAFYGESLTLRRLGDANRSQDALQEFQELSTNPRARSAELKYTRMGPKAEVTAGHATKSLSLRPTGEVFLKADAVDLARERVDVRPTVRTTVADLNGDNELDLLVADPSGDTQVLVGDSEGRFVVTPTHPLAGVSGVNAALWGDFDGDGLADVFLCRAGRNQLWRHDAQGGWSNVTDNASIPADEHNTIDGACYDFDHDGDLDYLLVNADAARQLLNNDRDGSFRDIASNVGVAGSNDGSRGLVIADLDKDDDADLVFLNEGRANEILRNDRLWRYAEAVGFDAVHDAEISAAVALDADVDGQVELYTAGPDGVRRWTPNDGGEWSAAAMSDFPATQLIAYDCNGDTASELVAIGPQQWRLLNSLSGEEVSAYPQPKGVAALFVRMASQGPELFGWGADGVLYAWRAGPARQPFVTLRFSGKTDRGQEMRSNASGIGVVGSARIGQRWAPLPGVRPSSAPGQSLQPVAIGAGGAESIDFLRLLWPDGVTQTELNLATGKLHQIAETQRQAGSCPLVFVWDGERFAFVADLLGAGGIGFNLGRGEYYPPRPEESLLLPAGVLQPRGDRLVVKLGEPMEEICYFDAVRLVAYDLPPGWSMTLDERFAGMGPPPTGKPIFFQKVVLPIEAKDDRGQDVTAAVQFADGEPVPLTQREHRFVGLTEPHSVTLEFAEPLDALSAPVLVLDGWVEYAYSQTAFAAWQAGEEFLEPTVEAQGTDGVWRVVAERFGYPAGTARQCVCPLSQAKFPEGATRLRISTNMEVYWDRIAVVEQQACREARCTEATLRSATVADVGFSARRLYPHRRTEYDYERRPPLGDARHPAGFYTNFGDATALVSDADDALAIIGPGEEVHLEYNAPNATCPDGWTRRWVLEADGWCKDADFYTRDAGSVEPLPGRAVEDVNPRRDLLHSEYNERFRSGF